MNAPLRCCMGQQMVHSTAAAAERGEALADTALVARATATRTNAVRGVRNLPNTEFLHDSYLQLLPELLLIGC